MTLDEFYRAHCTGEADTSEGGWDSVPLTIMRVWQYLTGWTLEQFDNPLLWRSFLNWPPDVFALCGAILGRSGIYSSASFGTKHGEGESQDLAEKWLDVLDAHDFEDERSLPNSRALESLEEKWGDLWRCRLAPLSRIVECDEMIERFVTLLLAADRVSEGSGLPISKAQFDSEHHRSARYKLISHGWKLLEPRIHGSSLCTRRIHPNAARVLPKMHVPQSGLTLRSLSHNLALCETAEVQPRWFMIPGARGNVANQHHINLLILPWPLTIDPAQFQESSVSGSSDIRYFDYSGLEASDLTDVIESFCDEAQRVLGSLDGVVMPELALTDFEYGMLRNKILARKVMLIAGVGVPASNDERGSNHVCIDVPLSKHHAVHFRQSKHHRWKLEQGQIVTYGIGSRLNPTETYWENIDVFNRKLLFLVLRPWLVTSVLICEDLARQDPVGDLLTGVGPHLVTALLMDGPQLTSRWPGRYAAALADDPGCSVVSVSSLGMVTLSRPNPTEEPNRTVALWKDSYRGAKELWLPKGAEALAITVSVEFFGENSADGRRQEAARPVLTGVHPICRKELSASSDSDRPRIHLLSPHEAADLARLVQQQGQQETSPDLLMGLTGEALAIGLEVWRLMTNFPSADDLAGARFDKDAFARLPEARHTETAEEICRWHATNIGQDATRTDLFPGEWLAPILTHPITKMDRQR